MPCKCSQSILTLPAWSYAPYSYFAFQRQIYFQSDAYSCRWYVRGEQTVSQLEPAWPVGAGAPTAALLSWKRILFPEFGAGHIEHIPASSATLRNSCVQWNTQASFLMSGYSISTLRLKNAQHPFKVKSQTLTGTNCGSVYVAIWNNLL